VRGTETLSVSQPKQKQPDQMNAQTYAKQILAKITVDPLWGCWTFTGSLNSDGYGQAWDGKRLCLVHREAYLQRHGIIPFGLQIDHLCRNRACCNPSHLEAVTQAVNIARGEGLAAINMRKTHCKRGHPLSGQNLYQYPDGRRSCRTCHTQKRNERISSTKR